MTEEYDDMSDLFEKRKKEIGETAELISRTTFACVFVCFGRIASARACERL